MSETEHAPQAPDEDPDQLGTDPPTLPEGEPTEPNLEPDETAAEEAAEAEREEDAAAEPGEPEPEGAVDEREIERRNKALTRAADAYVKKLLDTLGPDLDGARPCPLCADFFPGFRFPVMPPAENLAAVRVAIGLDPGDNLPKDNYSRMCTSCDGWGFTDSQSKVVGQTKLRCIDCEGKGWIAVGSERSGGSITGSNGHSEQPQVVLQENPSNDPPEVQRLKELGYVVVPPVQPIETNALGGV